MLAMVQRMQTAWLDQQLCWQHNLSVKLVKCKAVQLLNKQALKNICPTSGSIMDWPPSVWRSLTSAVHQVHQHSQKLDVTCMANLWNTEHDWHGQMRVLLQTEGA